MGSTAAPTASSKIDERLIVLFLAAAFILLNALTLGDFPVPMNDEQMCADPALNLVAGRGWTSGAWPAGVSDTWTGNAPLYSLVLTLPAMVAGGSLAALRAVNVLLALGAVLVLWAGSRKAGIVGRSQGILMLVVSLGAYGTFFCYRFARTDCLNMLLFSAAFYGIAAPRLGRARWPLLLFAGLLVPGAGLQSLLLVACYASVNIWWIARESRIRLIFFSASAVLGAFLFFGYLAASGHLQAFLHETVGSQTAIRSQGFAFAQKLGGLKDPSFWLLALAAAILYMTKRNRQWLAIGNVTVIPVVFAAVAKFPGYYNWMIFLPLVLIVCHSLTAQKFPLLERLLIVPAVALPLLLTGFGIYLSASNSEGQREQFLAPIIHATDNIYTDPAGYFVARKHTSGNVFGAEHILSLADRESLDLVILEQMSADAPAAAEHLQIGPGELIPIACEPIRGKRWTTSALILRNPELCAYRHTAHIAR